MCLNGAAARLAIAGDTVIILTYCHVEDEEARNFKPTLVYVNANNAITEIKRVANAVPF
jgi:aspartate 1-decarboxylase